MGSDIQSIIKEADREDTKGFIFRLIQETIINKVFSQIDEKQKYISKRRTWNKIRKDEKIKEVQEIRSKWKYAEPVVSIKSKLDKIFSNFEESQNDQKVEVSQSKGNL